MNKYIHSKNCLLNIVIILTLSQHFIRYAYSTQFNRNIIGIAFSAYVRSVPPSQNPNYDWERYSLEDIKTMLKVISGKFAKVATFGVGAQNVLYQENMTYHQSYAQVFTAEAAAILNNEANTTILEVTIGVWIYNDQNQMETEINLALESAQKANKIHPGTVSGLVFTENDIATNLAQAETTLAGLQKVKQKALDLGLKLGSRQSCKGPFYKDPLTNTRREIVKSSDFIICVVKGSDYQSVSPLVAHEQIKRDLIQYRNELKELNPLIEVMGQTGFSTAGLSQSEMSRLKDYWESVDVWATENNYMMWMFEAFDNPWKRWDPWAAHYGWWQLKNNDDVGNVDGYIEKVSSVIIPVIPTTVMPITTPETTPRLSRKPKILDGNDEDMTKNAPGNSIIIMTTSAWTYVAVGISLAVATTVICLFAIFYGRFRRLKAYLTKEEVKLFIDGKSCESVNSIENAENDRIETEALTKPYDQSLEISIQNLEIFWDSILGSGQFGCVYKAILFLPKQGSIDIALKMAKSGCPKDVVKSLLGEIKILSHLGKHPHLVSIKGAYTAEIHKGIVYVATELCELGSLKDYLRNRQQIGSRNSNSYEDFERISEKIKADKLPTDLNAKTTKAEALIDGKEMIRWSYEIACGMEYLGTKHVVHADLATRNILLTPDKTAKITDFGLSRRLYDYMNYVKRQQEPLPWRWMSIEALRKLEFSSQSDVWSYGITLWEIFSLGDVPYPGLSWTLDFVTKLENGLRMKCPRYASSEMFNVMTNCWAKEPLNRPKFTQLRTMIEEILENCE